MNNDLEDLYSSDSNNKNNNNDNNIINKDIIVQPPKISSIYNDSQTNKDNNIQEIKLNQEGLAKMYNQNTVDLDKESESTNTQSTILNRNENRQNQIIYERVTDEDLLIAYIGKKFTKIATKPINFAAFLFNIWYLFLRKKILYGIIVFITYLTLSVYINNFLVILGLSIILGVAFNGAYLKETKLHINRIKKKNNNKNMEEIRSICKKKGGLSIFYLFLGIAIQFFIGFLSIKITSHLGIKFKTLNFSYNEIYNIIKLITNK